MQVEDLHTHYKFDSTDVNDSILGRGRFAKVLLVRHVATNERYAAKVIPKRHQATMLQEVSVLRAAQDIASVVHLHHVLKVGVSDTALVLDFCSGGDLQRHVELNGALNEAEATYVLDQLLQALGFLHNLSLVHLDVKPENLLLKRPYPSLRVALCDFGLARQLDDQKQLRELIGTPDYAAPEVLNYDPIGLPADMWSVGCVAYFLVSGVSAFWAHSKALTLVRISKADWRLPDEEEDVDITITQHARTFLEQLLLLQPRRRMTVSQARQHAWLQLCREERHENIAEEVQTCNNQTDEGDDPPHAASNVCRVRS